MKYLYFPFANDISYDPTMPGNKSRYEAKYGNNLQVVQYPGSLAQVDPDEMVIVAEHGLPGKDRVGLSIDDPNTPNLERLGRWAGGHQPKTQQISVAANDLADRISQAGLKKNHKHIKLITCGGAGMAIADENSVVWSQTPANQRKVEDVVSISLAAVSTADCLASVLAKAMAQPGRDFTRLLVRGYPGFVNAMGLQKFLSLESSSGNGVYCKGVSEDTWTGEKKVYWNTNMIKIPTKALTDPNTGLKAKFWFDGTGNRVSPT